MFVAFTYSSEYSVHGKVETSACVDKLDGMTVDSWSNVALLCEPAYTTKMHDRILTKQWLYGLWFISTQAVAPTVMLPTVASPDTLVTHKNSVDELQPLPCAAYMVPAAVDIKVDAPIEHVATQQIAIQHVGHLGMHTHHQHHQVVDDSVPPNDSVPPPKDIVPPQGKRKRPHEEYHTPAWRVGLDCAGIALRREARRVPGQDVLDVRAACKLLFSLHYTQHMYTYTTHITCIYTHIHTHVYIYTPFHSLSHTHHSSHITHYTSHITQNISTITQSVDVQNLLKAIRANSTEFEAQGRVLRVKQHIHADAGPLVVDALLDALMENTRIEALYVQNLEQVCLGVGVVWSVLVGVCFVWCLLVMHVRPSYF